jgi:hypothetical protein
MFCTQHVIMQKLTYSFFDVDLTACAVSFTIYLNEIALSAALFGCGYWSAGL